MSQVQILSPRLSNSSGAMRPFLVQLLCVSGLLANACGGSDDTVASTEAATSAFLEPEAAVQADEAAPEPTIEDLEVALLEGFTKAIATRDIDQVASWLSPELGGELRRFHMADPGEFLARAAIWSDRAASGLELVARGSSDGFERWRGLVRFGNGYEESVVFGRFDGRVLLADL